MSPAVARASSNVAADVEAAAHGVPAAAVNPDAASAPGTRRVADDRIPLVLLLGAPLAITAWGWSYYAVPLAGRLRHPLHALLRPTGPVGLAAGVVGLALFLFLWMYAVRKGVKWLAWTGAVGSWMRVHVVAGLVVPVIVAVHAGWRFEGVIGLGYISMLVVSLSGLVGRYLYTHIPRRMNGLEMTLDEVAGERRSMLTRIGVATGLEPQAVERMLAVDARPYAGLDPFRTIARMLQDDWQRAALMRRLRREWSTPRPGGRRLDPKTLRETLKLARQEMALTQQVRMLEAARTLFGWWHVAHRPFAITALLAVLLHVIVAMVVGAVGLP